MHILRAPAALARQCIAELRRSNDLDATVRPRRDGTDLLIPVHEVPTAFDPTAFHAYLETANLDPVPPRLLPFDTILDTAHKLGVESHLLPRRWERIGDVLLLRPPRGIRWGSDAGVVAAAYGASLRARTVVEDLAEIRGPWRLPSVRWLWGGDTRTIHKENGVRFSLDVAKVMFSSGNLPERIRMARVPRTGETVVDLFAGIGYFAIPMAVHSAANRIIACEVNPAAFAFLKENARLNRVENLVPIRGDCRIVAPQGVADRVVMGHLDAIRYLDTAFRVAKDRATLYVHSVVRGGDIAGPEGAIDNAANRNGYRIASLARRTVKSYGPKVTHVVIEAAIFRSRQTKGFCGSGSSCCRFA